MCAICPQLQIAGMPPSAHLHSMVHTSCSPSKLGRASCREAWLPLPPPPLHHQVSMGSLQHGCGGPDPASIAVLSMHAMKMGISGPTHPNRTEKGMPMWVLVALWGSCFQRLHIQHPNQRRSMGHASRALSCAPHLSICTEVLDPVPQEKPPSCLRA